MRGRGGGRKAWAGANDEVMLLEGIIPEHQISVSLISEKAVAPN